MSAYLPAGATQSQIDRLVNGQWPDEEDPENLADESGPVVIDRGNEVNDETCPF